MQKFFDITNENTPTSVEEMTCDQILKSDISQLGYFQSFDGSNGRVALIGGRDCWREIQDQVAMAESFVRSKLAKLEEKGYDLHGLNLPTLEEYNNMMTSIPNYSDGLALITRWSWRASDI